MTKERSMAACGLICGTCHIHLAPENPKIAKKLVEDFKGRWENVKPEDFNCIGCWGEDDEMWSSGCEIRKCCIKDKNLNYCYECQEFPCQKLKEWANKDKKYEAALERLKNIKRK
ncbi:MAG: DUF3795 domain-containing protein [Candidatus Lokiarchaeota archaeon]|nr:DUF3795 domain-containing protein [Candidatus Lokiarchaeota archaeon]